MPSALRSPVIARSHARDLLEGLIEIGEIPEAAGLRYLKDRDIVFPKQADRALDTLQKQIFIRRNSGHAPENRRKMRAAHTGAPGDVVERQLLGQIFVYVADRILYVVLMHNGAH